MRSIVVGLAMLISLPALAQEKTFAVDSAWHFDDSDLGRAMAACRKHRHVIPVHQPRNRTVIAYDADWKSCDLIHEEWLKSPDAAAKEKAEAEDTAAKFAVDDLAKKLGAGKQ